MNMGWLVPGRVAEGVCLHLQTGYRPLVSQRNVGPHCFSGLPFATAGPGGGQGFQPCGRPVALAMSQRCHSQSRSLCRRTTCLQYACTSSPCSLRCATPRVASAPLRMRGVAAERPWALLASSPRSHAAHQPRGRPPTPYFLQPQPVTLTQRRHGHPLPAAAAPPRRRAGPWTESRSGALFAAPWCGGALAVPAVKGATGVRRQGAQ